MIPLNKKVDNDQKNIGVGVGINTLSFSQRIPVCIDQFFKLTLLNINICCTFLIMNNKERMFALWKNGYLNKGLKKWLKMWQQYYCGEQKTIFSAAQTGIGSINFTMIIIQLSLLPFSLGEELQYPSDERRGEDREVFAPMPSSSMSILIRTFILAIY